MVHCGKRIEYNQRGYTNEYDRPVDEESIWYKSAEVEPYDQAETKPEKTRDLGCISTHKLGAGARKAHLAELPPIEVVSSIKFEYEYVVDFGLLPDTTGQAKKER